MLYETVVAHWAALVAWRQHTRREPARAWAARAAEQLPALLADAARAVPGLADLPPAPAALAVGLAALGPEQAGPPPAALWDDLLGLSAAPTGDDLALQCCADLLVAWGCGWGNMRGGGPWGRRWPMAVWALNVVVERVVVRTARDVARRVPPDDAEQLRDLLPPPGQEHELARAAREQLADTISGSLIGGHCDCERSICGQQHRLAAWVPGGRSPLRLFVAQAVHGSASARPHTGALKERGILYRWLELHGVAIDQVEFKVCAGPACHAGTIERAVRTGERLQLTGLAGARPARLRRRPPLRGVFVGRDCGECQRPADPARTYHIPRRNWIITPAHLGGSYHEEPRARCRHCGTLYAHPPALDRLRMRIHELEAALGAAPPDAAPALRAELGDARRRRKEIVDANPCPLQGCPGGMSQRHALVWVRYDHAGLSDGEQPLAAHPADTPAGERAHRPTEVLIAPLVERPALLVRLGLRYLHQHPGAPAPTAIADTLWLQLAGFPDAAATHLGDAAVDETLDAWEARRLTLDRDRLAWLAQLGSWWAERVVPELARAHAAHGAVLAARLRGAVTPGAAEGDRAVLGLMLVVPRPRP